MGLEPTTRGLKGRCSNQLSYGPPVNDREIIPYYLCYDNESAYFLPLPSFERPNNHMESSCSAIMAPMITSVESCNTRP